MTILDLLQFLNQKYIMIVPALWVIGLALKHTPRVPDWTIIWILLLLSVGFGSFVFGFSLNGILNGVIAAGVAVLGHQMYKQSFLSKPAARKKKKHKG
ncbi:phage holin family protein [Bacillus infantis]|uniref:phage holin family protein n=1 Tax=Bacillus infantis TaxID=324767 RepID=UPI003D2ECB5F